MFNFKSALYREEKIVFTIKKTDGELFSEEVRKRIKAYCEKTDFKVSIEDNLRYTIEFPLSVSYNKCVDWLELVEYLIDEGFATKATLKELNHGKCLIQSVFLKMEMLSKKAEIERR